MTEELEFQIENLCKGILLFCGIVFIFIHPMIGATLLCIWAVVAIAFSIMKSLSVTISKIIARLEVSRRSIDG